MRVLVIGGGLMGVATAYFLRRHGHEVTVIERREKPARETSFANAGMLTPSMADPWNAPGILKKAVRWLGREDSPMLLRAGALPSLMGWGLRFLVNARSGPFEANMRKNVALALYSLSILQELRTRLHVDYDQTLRGTIKVFRNVGSLARYTELAAVLEQHGVAHRVLSSSEIADVEPALAAVSRKLVGAIHFPGDESGDARMFCRALAAEAQRDGVTFLFTTAVRGLEAAGGRVVAADTDRGRMAADAFVLAAGSYSPELAGPLALAIPVRPVKGYSITVSRQGWRDGPSMPVIDDALHLAVTPMGERLRVAGTAEFAGYDTSIRESRIRNLFGMLKDVFPGYSPYLDEANAERWAGLRPMSCDGVPILGGTGYENLFLNTGQGHLGWTMSCGSGRLVADLIDGREPEIDARPYGLDRF